jgi:FkbM family methyltransferase
MQTMLSLYRFVFCRKLFYRFNYHVYKIALRGIGLFNSEGNNVTGERYFLQQLQMKVNIRTVFDVGANTGEYTMDVRRYFPRAIIYAFEPHPQTYKKLTKNITKNHFHPYQLALGEKKGSIKLWDFAQDAVLKHTQPTSTLASVHKDVISGLHKQKAMSYSVPITTVDNIVKQERVDRIDLLKIDTEGSEFSVLQGAKEMIKKGKIAIIQFEFNEMNAYSRVFLKDYIDFLSDYAFFRLMPHGFYPMGEYRPSTHEIFAFQNIVAIHKDRLHEFI